MPKEVDFIHVDIPTRTANVPKMRYKVPEDGARLRTAGHGLDPKDVVRRHTLMNKFKHAEAGHTVRLTKAAKVGQHSELRLTQPGLRNDAENLKPSEFGIAFRTSL